MAAGLEALAVSLTERVLQQLPDLGRRRQPAVRKDGRSPACRLCRNYRPGLGAARLESTITCPGALAGSLQLSQFHGG